MEIKTNVVDRAVLRYFSKTGEILSSWILGKEKGKRRMEAGFTSTIQYNRFLT